MTEPSTLHYHMPCPVLDSHFHATIMANKGMDIHSSLKKSYALGLNGGLEVAIDENRFHDRLKLSIRFPWLRLSAGIHPSACVRDGKWTDRLALIEEQARHPAVVAIGETGLDFFRDYAPAQQQEEVFRNHLELASRLNKPVIVHNREADARILDIIRESSCRQGIMHCFSSDWETAKTALSFGFFISFAGNLTYKKTDAIRHAASLVPLDRLLIETDAPFLSPQRVRGKLNHPGHIGYTLECLAEIRNTTMAQLGEALVENGRFLGLTGNLAS